MSSITSKRRSAFTLVELLVVIAIIAILLALLIPAIQGARAAAARAECASKMRQLGLALHSYHDIRGSFPVQGTPDLDDNWGGEHAWMYRILPHIEQDALYRQGTIQDRQLRVDAGSQGVVPATPESQLYWDTWATPVPAFLCPSDPRPLAELAYQIPGGGRFAMTSYLGVSGRESWEEPEGPFGITDGSNLSGIIVGPKALVRISQITRGLSNTVMVGERPPGPMNHGGFWAHMYWMSSLWAIGNINLSRYIVISEVIPHEVCADTAYFSEGNINSYCHLAHFWSFHSGGANWLLADGSVQFMTYDAGETVIPEMASIKGI